MRDHIEYPNAYANAVQARIRHNKWKNGRRQLAETLANEPELLAWVTQSAQPSHLAAKAEAHAADVASGVCRIVGDDNYRYCANHAEGGNCPSDRLYDRLQADFFKSYGHPPRFLVEAVDQWGGLTERQLKFARDIWAERHGKATERAAQRAAERAQAEPWTAGRQVVEGVIVKLKEVEDTFARSYSRYVPTITKATIKTDRFQLLYCTLPSALVEAKVGSRVRFNITVEPKQDDPTFAFGKRPAKAEIITTTEEGAEA